MAILTELELLGRILIAGLCGAAVGFERKNRKKEAGIRTHIIVALASALMTIVSKYGFFDVLESAAVQGADIGLDPSRVAAGIVSGVGFLGAGMIFTNKKMVTGLTTAAGIWATTGVGMAIGAGLYLIGIVSAAFIVIAQIILHKDLKLLKIFSHESFVFTVKNYPAAIAYIEESFEKSGVTIDDIDIKKLGDGRAEIELSASFAEISSHEIVKRAVQNDNIERVIMG